MAKAEEHPKERVHHHRLERHQHRHVPGYEQPAQDGLVRCRPNDLQPLPLPLSLSSSLPLPLSLSLSLSLLPLSLSLSLSLSLLPL